MTLSIIDRLLTLITISRLNPDAQLDSTNELITAMDQVEILAEEILQQYPWQNLRQMRPYFLNGANPDVSDELKVKRTAVFDLLTTIKSLKASGAGRQLGNKAQQELAGLAKAETLLDVVELYAPTNARTITVMPPDNLASYQVTVTPESTALAVFRRLIDSPKLKAAFESTAQAEAKINKGGPLEWLLAKLFGRSQPVGQRSYNFYLTAYNIDHNLPLPGLEALQNRLASSQEMVANPYRIWITDFAAQANTAGNLSLVASYGDRYIDLDQQLPIFQFIKTHEKSYQEAANLLYDSHPDLSQETLTTFLMLNTYVEIFWMTNEDPWQDTAIASWFEVNQATDFKAAYRKLTKAGLVFGPKMKDGGKEVVAQIPAWGIVWRAASLKVPVSAQGIGPNAILIGDLLEASRYDQGTLWKKYFPKILPSTENAVKIALDPALSILAVALAYDVKLRDLNEAVFFDPTVRLPANTYPSISDPAKAREYFKLTWVRYCKAFPEVSVNFPDYFAYGHNAWNIDFIDSYFKLIESVMGRPDSWPDLEMNFIPSRDKNIADYFGDKNNPMNMDALMLISLPRSSN